MMLLAIGVSRVMLGCEVDGDVRGAAHASVHATILSPNLRVAWGRLAPCHCLAIFDPAAEAVKVAFAKHHFLACLLKLQHHGMHAIDSCLERLKIGRDGHYVFVQCCDLDLLALEACIDCVQVSFGRNEAIESRHIELIPHLVHSSILHDELLL